MMRRRFFSLLPAGLWSWRMHVLLRHGCAGGGLLMLVLRGEPWKLTERERQLVDFIADHFRELEPSVLQERAPKL